MNALFRTTRLLLLALLVAAGPLHAATIAWDGGGDGTTFTDPANWAGDAVPGPGDHADITLAGTYTVSLTSTVSIAGLTLGGASGAQTLDVKGFRLDLGTDSSFVNANGTLVVGGATDSRNFVLGIDGPLVVRGRFDWTNGTVNANTYYLPPNGRVITIAPGGMMRWISGERYLTATLENHGTLRWEGGTTWYTQGYAHSSSGLFDIDLAADATFGRTGINGQGPWVFTNTGVIRKTGPGAATIQVELRTIGGTVDVQEDTLLQNYTSRWENTTISVAAGATLQLSSNRTSEPHTVSGTLSGNVLGTFMVKGPSFGYFAVLDADRTTGGEIDITGTGVQLDNASLGGVYDPPTMTYSPAPVNRGLMRLVGGSEKLVSGAFINRDTLRWEAGRLTYYMTASFANEAIFEMALDTDFEFIPGGINGIRPGPLMNTGTVVKTGAGTVHSTVEVNTIGGLVDVRKGSLVQEWRTRWEHANVAVSAGATLRLGGYLLEHVIAGTLSGDAQGTLLVSGLVYSYYTRLVADSVLGGRLEIIGTGMQLGDVEVGVEGGLRAPVNGGLLRFVGSNSLFVRTDFRNEGTARWESGNIYATAGILLANVGLFEIFTNGGSLFGSGSSSVATLLNDTAGIMRKTDTVQSILMTNIINNGRLSITAGTLRVENAFNNLNSITSTAGGIIAGAGTFDVTQIPAPRLHNDGTTAPGPGDVGEGIGTLTVRGALPYNRIEFQLGGTDSALYDRLIVAGSTPDLAAVTLFTSLTPGFTPVSGDFFDVISGSVANRVLDVVEAQPAIQFIDTYPGAGVRLVLDTAAGDVAAIEVRAPVMTVRQGETPDVPVTVIATAAARKAGATAVTFALRFNATMPGPIETTPRGRIVGNERIIDLRIPLSTSGDTTIVRYRFAATLGNDSTTALIVDSAASDAAGVPVTGVDGRFTLANVCREGDGARLLNPNGVVAMSKVRPNPLTESLAFDLDLIETGATSIVLCDLAGNTVRRCFDGEIPPGRRSVQLDLGDVPSGRYLIIVQTPTVRLAEQVEVVR